VSRGLGIGWWSVAYDTLPVARCAAEERRNVRIASDFNAAIRSLGFCLAIGGALTEAYARGRVAGIEDGKYLAPFDGRSAEQASGDGGVKP
jgi:hypothetical protein